MKIGGALAESYDATRQIESVRRQLMEVQARALRTPDDGQTLAEAINILDRKIAALVGAGASSQNAAAATQDLPAINANLASLLTTINGSDAAPTAQALAAFDEDRRALYEGLAAWAAIRNQDLASLNTTLRQRRLPVIEINAVASGPVSNP